MLRYLPLCPLLHGFSISAITHKTLFIWSPNFLFFLWKYFCIQRSLTTSSFIQKYLHHHYSSGFLFIIITPPSSKADAGTHIVTIFVCPILGSFPASIMWRFPERQRACSLLHTLFFCVLMMRFVTSCDSCSPGHGTGLRRMGPPKKYHNKPFLQKQYYPEVDEYSKWASGPAEGKILRKSRRFRYNLVRVDNPNVIFRDEERTGADRYMTRVSFTNRSINQLVVRVILQSDRDNAWKRFFHRSWNFVLAPYVVYFFPLCELPKFISRYGEGEGGDV